MALLPLHRRLRAYNSIENGHHPEMRVLLPADEPNCWTKTHLCSLSVFDAFRLLQNRSLTSWKDMGKQCSLAGCLLTF